MPLPTFATRDEIPEAVRDGYVERGGKWVPDVEDVSGLKDSQRRALDEKKKLEDQMRAALGDHKLEEVAELLKKQREIEEAQARKAGDFDKLLEKRVGETKTEYEKRIKELEAYKQKYEDSQLDTAIRKPALAAGVDPKDLEEYVIPLLKGRRIRLDGDKIVVLDKDGDPTGLTTDKFFAEVFKTESPKFYLPVGGSGGGSGGGSATKVPPGGAVRVDDAASFIANLDGIAAGKVKAVA